MRKPISLLLLGATLTVSGCFIPSVAPPANNLSDISDGSVILVGRIELVPPLDAKDQVLKGPYADTAKNIVYINLTPQLVDEDSAPNMGPTVIQDKLGQFFFAKIKPGAIYIQDMMIYTAFTPDNTDSVKLPGGLKIDIRKGDRAVYIGTFRFTRNEYFDITKAQYINEYARANAEFRRKFHASFNLRNNPASPVKGQ